MRRFLAVGFFFTLIYCAPMLWAQDQGGAAQDQGQDAAKKAADQQGMDEATTKAFETFVKDAGELIQAVQADRSLVEANMEKLHKMSQEFMANVKPFRIDHFHLMNSVASVLQSNGQYERAKSLLAEIKTASESYSDKEIAGQMASMIDSSLKKLNIMGSSMEIAGKTVGGEDFNLEQYKGKVVLVDFWATWCDPCIAELPNVKENYKKYHDQGLEIVGVSLDEAKSQADVAKFLTDNDMPWVNLFSTDEAATGWQHPLATKYGINSIPATFLIDREGKVIAMDVRGESLGGKLAELFPEAGK